MAHKNGMPTYLLMVILFSYSCVQNQNSSTSDKEQYTTVVIDTSTPAGARLSAAYKVIKKNCVGCHSIMNISTDSEWLSSGYISQGSATSSILYCRLNGSKCGAEDMPNDGALSDTDLNTIKTWIDNL